MEAATLANNQYFCRYLKNVVDVKENAISMGWVSVYDILDLASFYKILQGSSKCVNENLSYSYVVIEQ